MSTKKMVSVLMTSELQDVLRMRAKMNNRSLTKEILFLIETALAIKSETTREFIQFMHQAGHFSSDPLGDDPR
jgi:hypothetical protein